MIDHEVQSLSGRAVNLSDYRGKVVIINFWTTWCPPCREELPSMNRAWHLIKEEGIAMLAIKDSNMDGILQINEFFLRADIIVLATPARTPATIGPTDAPIALAARWKLYTFARWSGANQSASSRSKVVRP